MFSASNNSSLTSDSSRSFSSRSATLFANRLDRPNPQQITSFGTRSRLEIGELGQVFSSSGSVTRQFPDVFRFSLQNRSRLRIYLGNEFTNTRNNNQRMTVDLLNDRNLRRVDSMVVNPRGIDAITRRIDPGTYRVRISTQTNSRGRYFIDMVRL
jgi:hypothetical protein